MKYTTNRPGSIYIFHAEGTNRYKIGRATDVFKRYKTLKRQSAYPLIIVKYLYTLDMVFDESAMHKEFKKRRVHGEWFEFENQDDALDDFRPHTMLYLINDKENELSKLDLGLDKDSEALEITFSRCINKAHEENKYVEYYKVISELIKTSQKNFYYGLDFTSYVVGYLQAAYLDREHDEINKQLAPDLGTSPVAEKPKLKPKT